MSVLARLSFIAPIMQKLDAKKVADLVRIVVGNFERSEAGD
jgi:hypothetical protein